MMFESIALSAVAHSTYGYDNQIDLPNTSAAISLDNHGDARPDSTWILTTASVLLTITWENLPDAVKNRSVKNGRKM